eukprot:8572440-Alexandrium_andersonii.AAC.1
MRTGPKTRTIDQNRGKTAARCGRQGPKGDRNMRRRNNCASATEEPPGARTHARTHAHTHAHKRAQTYTRGCKRNHNRNRNCKSKHACAPGGAWPEADYLHAYVYPDCHDNWRPLSGALPISPEIPKTGST